MKTLPEVTSTMTERSKALDAAKILLAARTPFTTAAVDVTSLMRLAEYIATGHDYYDTHPSVDKD